MILRDFTPDNELRYLSIAKEATENGNLFAFYNHGLMYADKPPLYIWLLMLANKVSLGNSMFFLSLFSIIPAYVTTAVMSNWVSPYVEKEKIIIGQFLLLSTAYFLASSVIVRMDMLMGMFIVLSLYTFFKMYKGNCSKKNRLLFPLFLFLSLFSKGLLGLLIPIVTIIVFLLIKREKREIINFLGWKTFIPLFLLVAVWMILVFYDGGYEYFNNLVFHQTLGRAINSFHHRGPFYFYLINMWYIFFPWTFLYVFVFFLSVRKRLINSDLKLLFLTAIGVIFILLSLISSKVDIYLLPAIPFITFLTVLLLKDLKDTRLVKLGLIIPNIIFLLAIPVSLFLNYKNSFLSDFIVYMACFVLLLFVVISLYFIFKNEIESSIIMNSIGLFSLLFIFAFSLPDINPYIGYSSLSDEINTKKNSNPELEISSYRLKNAKDMDVYYGDNIDIINKQDLDNIDFSNKNLLILTKIKTMENDELFNSRAKSMNRQKIGEYLILTNNKDN